MMLRFIFLVAFAFLVSSCGYGQFQTARTLKRGQFKITLADSYQMNNTRNIADVDGVMKFAFFPANLDFRAGLSDHVDMGVKLFMLTGLLTDVKVNLMKPSNKFALSLGGGIGYAIDFGHDDLVHIINVPVSAIVSYTFLDALTPYFGLTYNIFWILGREADSNPEPGFEYVAQKGYGDHLLRFSTGAEWVFAKHFGIIGEYSLWVPIINDSGDNFKFVVNHFVGLGMVIPF